MPKLSRSQKEKVRRKDRRRSQLNFLLRKTSLRKMIRTFDDPILSCICYNVREDDDISYIKTLKEVLCSTDNGVGLAASQIGISRAVVALRFDPKQKDVQVMINPEITFHNDKMETDVEGCLSYPGVVGRISRFTQVIVKYLDESRQEKTETFDGFKARVVQHEIEHCGGACSLKFWWEQERDKKK